MYTVSCLRNARRCGLFATLWIFLGFGIVSPCTAETKTIRGIAFTVDEIRPTGGGYSAVVVGEESRLLEDGKVDTFIIEQYFRSRELFLRLSTKQVEDFVLQSTKEKALIDAAIAIRSLFEFGDAANAQVVSFFDQFQNESLAPEVFKILLVELPPSAIPPRILSIMITRVGLSDLPWTRQHASRVLYTHGEEIRSYIRTRIYDQIKDQNLQEAEPLIALMREIFSLEDPEVKSLQLLLVKLQSLLSGDAYADTPATLSDLSGGDPALFRYLAPIFTDTMHQRALSALKSENPEQALGFVSAIDMDKRTPATHSLFIEGLNALRSDSDIFVRAEKVTDYVTRLSEKDSYVREAYIDALERMIRDRLMKGLLIESREIFQILGRVRPDPNSLNDAVRVQGAKILIETGKNDKANQLLGDVQTGVSLFQKISILVLKLIHSPGIIVAFLVGVVSVIGLLLVLLRKITSSTPREPIESSHEEVDEERPAFVTARGGRGGGLPHEYMECLHEFGLSPDCTMKEIKAAFRNRVKDIHPDHQHASNDDPAEFIRIKNVYERLLDIRKRMGLEGS